MSRKVETTHLQVKSVKNASSLGTDEDGNVIAVEKTDDKEIDLSKYQLKPQVITFPYDWQVSTTEYTIEDANNTILLMPGMDAGATVKYYFTDKSLPNIGDSMLIHIAETDVTIMGLIKPFEKPQIPYKAYRSIIVTNIGDYNYSVQELPVLTKSQVYY
ncbi:hypothetical protein [Tenacibaculum finnmarkense]|uniref:hypothetical protein n=1 Tax=Tenacibaculum finnmarkense TaxID=2781243 RepID=UPI00187B5793|nr:hypothetical protein [Tenacibaculum finnmarkense]MBE7648327.1 hypothetical protein [Tenacibaculum finnmarkense genomovar ulcerans]